MTNFTDMVVLFDCLMVIIGQSYLVEPSAWTLECGSFIHVDLIYESAVTLESIRIPK